MMAGKGDLLPVSRLPGGRHLADWAPRSGRSGNIADEIPIWDPTVCIQCNKCALVCPHAAIRAKVYEPAAPRRGARTASSRTDYKAAEFKGLQVHHPGGARRTAPAAASASMVCPAKDKANPRHKAINMAPQRAAARGASASNYDFFLDLPELDRATG